MRVILLTDYSADTQGGGAVILRSLIDPENLIWIGLSKSSNAEGLSSFDYRFIERSLFHTKNSSIILDSIFAYDLAAEVIKIAKKEDISKLWVVMHGATVHVAAILVKTNKFQIHASIHDDPVAYSLISRKRFWLTPLVDKDLAYTLKKAKSIDVVSESMSAYYKRKYNVSSDVVHRALEPIEKARAYDYEQYGLSIGIIGNNYSYEQLPLLCRAMIGSSSIIGIKARLVIIGNGYGNRLKQEFYQNLDIEVTGHLGEKDGISTLQSCLLLYLNYPFTRNFQVFRSTSFPTKLSTYIQAVRPILIHAPSDSSVIKLTSINMRKYIYSWQNLMLEEGVKTLINCWGDQGNIGDWETASAEVRKTYFDPVTNCDRIHNLLTGL